MKLHLTELDIAFKRGREQITFADFTYFYGQMGAGKTTIAKLVDFCFGGDLGEKETSPALQREFIGATLAVQVNEVVLMLERNHGSNQIRASWDGEAGAFQVLAPARKAAGEILTGTGVETLSDLVYYLAGIVPPKVRRSKLNEDSDLERLSLRNLLWYCYLDQDSMDSSFFHLDKDSDKFKMYDSRDVIRYLVGFHQEQVAELEAKLEYLRGMRQRNEAAAQALEDALETADIGDATVILAKRNALDEELATIEDELGRIRQEVQRLRTHAIDQLQAFGRAMTHQLADLYSALEGLGETLSKDRSHRNELTALASRYTRSQSARELLAGVEFHNCPKCGLDLPERGEDVCGVCGQVHGESPTSSIAGLALQEDLDTRRAELDDIINRQERQLKLIQKQIGETEAAKAALDVELNAQSEAYDSAYLSTALEKEKRKASIQQELRDLSKLETVAHKIEDLTEEAYKLEARENGVKDALRKAREKAEKDTKNLKKLRDFFLDCLVRSKLAGFLKTDIVEMKSPHLLPEVHSVDDGDVAVVSFTNLSSGGKKTLFKCCFAVAMHRLSHEVGGILPSFMIIDTPMKSISERENRQQFEGFFEMLYELSTTELEGTQFIVIDKELCGPPQGYSRVFKSRHMKPNEEGVDPKDNPDPPLIRYYTGK